MSFDSRFDTSVAVLLAVICCFWETHYTNVQTPSVDLDGIYLSPRAGRSQAFVIDCYFAAVLTLSCVERLVSYHDYAILRAYLVGPNWPDQWLAPISLTTPKKLG